MSAMVPAVLTGLAVLLALRPPRRRRTRFATAAPWAVDPATVAVPVVLELVAAALTAGLPTGTALDAVRGVVPGAVDDQRWRALLRAATTSGTATVGRPGLEVAADVGPELAALARALVLADRTGASIAVLLRRAADDERAARRRRVSVAAGRLGVRLVLPLGLATLPAFVLLGVAPVVIGLASDVLRAR